MHKPEVKKDMRGAISEYVHANEGEIRHMILAETDIASGIYEKASLYDQSHVLIQDYYEDLRDYRDDLMETYEEFAKGTKVYFLFVSGEVIDVYFQKDDLDYYADYESEESEKEKDITGRESKVEAAESTLWGSNPRIDFKTLSKNIKEWGKQRNYVRELFLAAVKDGKLRAYVSLNFKPSKLNKPVMSWDDKHWSMEMAKFAFFRDILAQEGRSWKLGEGPFGTPEKVFDDQLAPLEWSELENDLAAKILKDYEEGRL